MSTAQLVVLGLLLATCSGCADAGIRLGWAQWTMLAASATALAITAHDHGKPRTGTVNVWIAAIFVALELGLLTAGGFFTQPATIADARHLTEVGHD